MITLWSACGSVFTAILTTGCRNGGSRDPSSTSLLSQMQCLGACRKIGVFNASILYRTGTPLSSGPCDRILAWDEGNIPCLVLNSHTKRLTSPTCPIIQFALRAVNQGIVYCKTTEHAPCDTRIANAWLMFRLVKLTA
jgi:hypothetical protein